MVKWTKTLGLLLETLRIHFAFRLFFQTDELPIGSRCEVDAQCSLAVAKCVNNTCSCSENFTARNGTCHSLIGKALFAGKNQISFNSFMVCSMVFHYILQSRIRMLRILFVSAINVIASQVMLQHMIVVWVKGRIMCHIRHTHNVILSMSIIDLPTECWFQWKLFGGRTVPA